MQLHRERLSMREERRPAGKGSGGEQEIPDG